MILNTKIAEKSSSPGATLLWTNPSSDSSWYGGVVTLESGYHLYLVEFAKWGSTPIENPIAVFSYTETPFYFGTQVYPTVQIGGVNGARKINYVRDGEISFGNGYYDGTSESSPGYFKALRIWGIK